MPGLRLKCAVWHIEKRCEHIPGGWLRESTGKTRRVEAEQVLIQRLAEFHRQAERSEHGVHMFEEAALRYIEDLVDKPSVDDLALHVDALLPFVGHLRLDQIHSGTLKPFVDHELARALAPKSINNVLGVVSAILNRAARVWRDEQGRPWLIQAPPLLQRLPTKGRQASPYPMRSRIDCSIGCRPIWWGRPDSRSVPAAGSRRFANCAGTGSARCPV